MATDLKQWHKNIYWLLNSFREAEDGGNDEAADENLKSRMKASLFGDNPTWVEFGAGLGCDAREDFSICDQETGK